MPDDFKINSNFEAKSREINKYAKELTPRYLREAMSLALEAVGLQSAQEYFVQTTARMNAFELPADPIILTMRSGRLVGSVVGAQRFNAVMLPQSVEQFQQGKFRSSSEDFGKGKKESIREIQVKTGGLQGIIGTNVPYGEKHEKGQGVKMRKFLEPAVKDEIKDTIPQIFAHALEASFKREEF